MAGVWVVLTVLAVVVAAPGLLGSYLLAQHSTPRVLRVWFSVLALVNLAALVVGILAMPRG